MIIFATAWYIFKAKFEVTVYQKWIKNLLTNAKNVKIVIFTNVESKWVIEPFLQPEVNEYSKNIKMVILEIEEFYGYKYKTQWINNHTENHALNNRVEWKVNMLWNEKVAFVKRVVENNYFSLTPSEEEQLSWVGWCDIGYFRGGDNNMNVYKLKEWANDEALNRLNVNNIYYTQICGDDLLNQLKFIKRSENPSTNSIIYMNPILAYIAGGFFLVNKKNIQWWYDTYYSLLKCYFTNNCLVKDDQIIIMNCIINHPERFELITEKNKYFDPWFAFGHYLL